MFDHKNSHPQLSRLNPAIRTDNDEWKPIFFHTLTNKNHSKLMINHILIQNWHMNLKPYDVVTPRASLKPFALDILRQLQEK